MSLLAPESMIGLLTRPYRRGGEMLEVVLAPDEGDFTPVEEYDFLQYRARYAAAPSEPKYVVYLKSNVPTFDLELEVIYEFQSASHAVTVHVPAGSLVGASFHIPIPAGTDATLRLIRFRQLPVALPGAGMDNFGITALLGNISKLAWVVGAEKDLIRGNLSDVKNQRHIALAHGSSLDALGQDLAIPRFPARQYSFDLNTLVLLHLDDGDTGVVVDETRRFGLTGHAGTNHNAQSGAVGKFANGFRFPGTKTGGSITLDDDADFDLPAEQGFTVETFLKSDGSPNPGLLIGKGAIADSGELTASGWALTVGNFRGTMNNLKFAANDGANGFEIFADLAIGNTQFHHVAGVLDRRLQRARLVVDGEVRATADLSGILDLTNDEPIRIGASATGLQFSGVLDEIRLSAIARTEFDPALGEGDESYRRRLEIYRSWRLPTPSGLLQMINSLVKIDDHPDSFVLIEQTRTLAMSTKLVRILPASLAPGQSISKEGDTRARESAISGTADQDPDFQTIYLQRHDSPSVDYGGIESNRNMQLVTTRPLDVLVGLLAAAQPAIAGQLQIHKSYDPNSSGLHSVGRALRMGHDTLAPSQLAVFAHRAGFDFVLNAGSEVYASVAAGEKLEITIEPRAAAEIPPDGSDLFFSSEAPHVLDVHIVPDNLPSLGSIRWTMIACGNGRVTEEPHPSDPVTLRTPLETRPHLRLRSDGPGEVTLRVEYTLARKTVSGTRKIRITVETLDDGASITADGNQTRAESDAVDTNLEPLNNDYLISPAITVNFSADPDNKLMQIVLEKTLLPMLRLLDAIAPPSSDLEILKAFDPADTGLHKVGRALRLSHPSLDAGRLAALAHQAGFGFVRREGNEVYCSVDSGELIEISQTADLSSLPEELTVGASVNMTARFSTLPTTGSFTFSTTTIGRGTGAFDFVLRPRVTFTPARPGLLILNLSYFEEDPKRVLPYTVEVRLNDDLDVPETIIPKTQYDQLMNILSSFHPIGVEVITESIRAHVIEIEDNPLNAFPRYVSEGATD